jgi:hypothetical protein
MKYFTALSLVAGLAAADMHVMKVHQQAANGAMTHTVSARDRSNAGNG